MIASRLSVILPVGGVIQKDMLANLSFIGGISIGVYRIYKRRGAIQVLDSSEAGILIITPLK